MKAMVIEGGFGLKNLKIEERPRPEPGPGQVLVQMRAASLNYRDLMTVQGSYNPKQPLPLVPCSDGVGHVAALGAGVTRLSVGDRVCPIFCQNWIDGPPTRDGLRSTLGGPLDGTLAEWMVVNAEGLVVPPASLSDLECAALPCAGVTAWTALFTEGELRPGQTVLVLGTGGVSLFALQLAKARGARVILTSSSEEKLERAKALGADEVLNYLEHERWGRVVREMTSGRGVDHVVEVGGAGTLEESLQATAIGGRIAVIGVLSGLKAQVPVTSILMGYIRLQGVLVGPRASFEALCAFMSEHSLKPVLGAVFPFAEARAGFELMSRGGHFGKIALKF
ncbi:MAG: NAD(P)-dependent alcohol dehydrogenase [Polyangia bacterium]|nr:NAD(P)-dependent alcohol dehydrogenase [Polyangia bacterium]